MRVLSGAVLLLAVGLGVVLSNPTPIAVSPKKSIDHSSATLKAITQQAIYANPSGQL
jgi:hypothetical protein